MHINYRTKAIIVTVPFRRDANSPEFREMGHPLFRWYIYLFNKEYHSGGCLLSNRRKVITFQTRTTFMQASDNGMFVHSFSFEELPLRLYEAGKIFSNQTERMLKMCSTMGVPVNYLHQAAAFLKLTNCHYLFGNCSIGKSNSRFQCASYMLFL